MRLLNILIVFAVPACSLYSGSDTSELNHPGAGNSLNDASVGCHGDHHSDAGVWPYPDGGYPGSGSGQAGADAGSYPGSDGGESGCGGDPGPDGGTPIADAGAYNADAH